MKPSLPSRDEASSRTQVVVITGMSGAGKSTAIHALEDLGYYCCDNLPTMFGAQIVSMCEGSSIRRICLGIDARLGDFLTQVDEGIHALDGEGSRDIHVLFIDASDEAIVRRFSETRRPHPMSPGGDVIQGIARERELLAPLRARSTRIIDTTRFSVHELRRALVAQFSPVDPDSPSRMVTRLVSFGFKYGAPVDADLLFDVRFMVNPYFVPGMKHRPGTDKDVAQFVLQTQECEQFIAMTTKLLAFCTPLYAREGKAYLTIGIGCTGGRHRSVAVANELARRLAENAIHADVSHRDVHRGGPPSAPLPSTPNVSSGF